VLAQAQLERAQALFERGAIARKDVEVAQDTVDKARVDVETATEHLHVLGLDPSDRPASTVDVVAPASGVITEQNVTNAAGVKSLDNSPNLFTISDLSRVWIVCDVYENDLRNVRVGIRRHSCLGLPGSGVDRADQQHRRDSGSRHPDRQSPNRGLEPGLVRIGLFVTATLRRSTETHAAVPLPPSCTYTTVTGCTCRSTAGHSNGGRWPAVRCSPAPRRNCDRACGPASASSPTRSSFRTLSSSNQGA
jgi:cobalt-zinc-cadmium efflux system membrane fusion protein